MKERKITDIRGYKKINFTEATSDDHFESTKSPTKLITGKIKTQPICATDLGIITLISRANYS